MSYYLRILCKSSMNVLRSEIIAFVQEGVYFESSVEFVFPSDKEDGKDVPEWEELQIRYDPTKRPIMLANTGDTVLLREELRDLHDVLNKCGPGPNVTVQQHLEATRRIIAIEMDPEYLSKSAWVMLDCLQSFLAARLDGMIFAPDDGFYDASLRLVASVRKRDT